MKNAIFLVVLLSMSLCSEAQKLRMPAILSDGMMLQQDTVALLWGWANPTREVKVKTSWEDRIYKTRVNRDAKWELHIKTPKSNVTGTITIISNRDTIHINDVAFGEVWLCSGQSNMEYSGEMGIKDIKDEYSQCAAYPIRYFHIPRNTASYPQDDVYGEWCKIDANTLKNKSAVAYFFAKTVNSYLNVPVGIVQAAWGGTPIEVWMAESLFTKYKSLEKTLDKIPPAAGRPSQPGYAFNAMVNPILSMTMQGVLWYQGETNAEYPMYYAEMFKYMVEDWRERVGNSEWPFFYVQIAPYNYHLSQMGPLLMEQQTKCQHYPYIGMVTVWDDVPNVNDIHPYNKAIVGKRLAHWALHSIYKCDIADPRHPEYESMKKQGDKLILSFKYVGEGLTSDGEPLREFEVAGEDRLFYPAKAKITKKGIVVHSDKVNHPVAVRFGFKNKSIPNLYRKDGTPVIIFRTDEWPVEMKALR